MRLLFRKASGTNGSFIRNGRRSVIKLGFKDFRSIATASCRAVLLPRFGGPDVLDLRDNVPVPELKPNEVLVHTRAVSINPLDTRVCTIYITSLCVHYILIFSSLVKFQRLT